MLHARCMNGQQAVLRVRGGITQNAQCNDSPKFQAIQLLLYNDKIAKVAKHWINTNVFVFTTTVIKPFDVPIHV